MEHPELDHWIKTEMEMSNDSVLVYCASFGMTKTAITKNTHSGNVWLYQSSADGDTGLETEVDVIRLPSDIVEVLKNKC